MEGKMMDRASWRGVLMTGRWMKANRARRNAEERNGILDKYRKWNVKELSPTWFSTLCCNRKWMSLRLWRHCKSDHLFSSQRNLYKNVATTTTLHIAWTFGYGCNILAFCFLRENIKQTASFFVFIEMYENWVFKKGQQHPLVDKCWTYLQRNLRENI